MIYFDYLIAYKFTASGYIGSNDGTISVRRTHKIDSIEELEKTRKFIEEKIIENGYKEVANVGIYNIVFLGEVNKETT